MGRPRTIPKLRKKTPAERGPVDPDSLVAALFWDRLAPPDPIDQPQAVQPAEKGGPGSGNWGHRGRPGTRGGSAAGTGGAARSIYGYTRAKRDAAIAKSPAAKAVDDSLRATFASRYPGMDQEKIDVNTEMLHDALQLGPDRWDHYAPKYGIDPGLRDAYYADIGQVDKNMAVLEQQVKDRATIQHPDLNKPLFDVWMDPDKDEAYGQLVGKDHAEAEALFAEKFGVGISDNTWHGVPEDVRHQNASNMYNAASDNPVIAHVLRGGQVKAIAYQDPDAYGLDTAWASWDGSKIAIKGLDFGTKGDPADRRFPLPAGIFVHEMGHALESHAISRGLMDTKAHYSLFGRGKHVSSYGWKTSGEDFAETFRAWAVGDSQHNYREHAPMKHAYLDTFIPEVLGQ